MGETESDWCSVTSLVPQGSVLGPLLFIIYINDLPECLSNPSLMYADDCKVIAEVERNGSGSLQSDIDAVVKWSYTWAMELVKNKCKVMHIGTKNPRIRYYIGDSILSKIFKLF